jgi:hypothetical protein
MLKVLLIGADRALTTELDMKHNPKGLTNTFKIKICMSKASLSIENAF